MLRSWVSLLVFMSGLNIAFGQGGVTTVYDYDEVGNRVAATDLIRFTDTQVFAFQPAIALHGERVNIFGRNLPPGDGRGFTVTFNGVPADILAVGTRVLTVEVPQGAFSGPLVVTLPDSTVVDLGRFAVEGIVISPIRALITFSQMIPFQATVTGADDQSVTWEVGAVPGSDPDEGFGTISLDGVYTPPDPSDLSMAGEVRVKATSGALPHATAFARIMLFGTVGGSPPLMLILPGPGDPGGLQANVTVGLPLVSFILPGPGEPDELQPNTTVANPPVSVEFEAEPP